MPTLQTSCSGIDMEQTQGLVVLHLENVAVATDKQFGRIEKELLANADIITSRVATDVGHQYVCPLTGPSQFLGVKPAKVTTVTIAEDSTERTEILQTHGQLKRTDIAGMPDFVARLKIFQIAIIPIGMCVAEKSDAFQSEK